METDEKYVKEATYNFIKEEVARIGEKLTEAVGGACLEHINNYDRIKGLFISRDRSVPLGSETFLFVLRKWNSYTPSLPINASSDPIVSQHSVGGGYFLHMQSDADVPGYGLVIDPGYNFIHNYGLAGFSLDDLDGIFITHAHNDHTNDFESLLSILYQRNNVDKPYKGHKKYKKIDLFMNVGSFKKFSSYIDLASEKIDIYIRNVIVVSPGEVFTIPQRPDIKCRIAALHTKHHELITAKYSLGLCLSISERSIVFTGDTGWSEELADKNMRLLKENQMIDDSDRGVDVLVAHLGSIGKREFDIKEGETLNNYLYKNHLGIIGTISSIHKYKPDVCIISEFGEELCDLRQALTEAIDVSAKKIKGQCICLPGDIGLGVFLDTRMAVDYLNKTLVEYSQIKYSDINDSNNQKNIKYYSGEVPNGGLSDVPYTEGLVVYKKSYFGKIFTDTGHADKDKDQLLIEASRLRLSADEDNTDTLSELRNLFLALSYKLESNEQIIPILMDECLYREIIEHLDNIGMDMDPLKPLIPIAEDLGLGFIDDDKTTVEEVFYEEIRPKIRMIINYYIDHKCDEIVRVCNEIRAISLQNIWPKLDDDKKTKILHESKNLREEGWLESTYKTISAFIHKTEEAELAIEKRIESYLHIYFDPDTRCWKGRVSISIDEIREEIKNLDAGIRESALQEFEHIEKIQLIIHEKERRLADLVVCIEDNLTKTHINISEHKHEHNYITLGLAVLFNAAAQNTCDCTPIHVICDEIMRLCERIIELSNCTSV